MKKMRLLMASLCTVLLLTGFGASASADGCEVYLSDLVPLYETNVHGCLTLNSVYWMPNIIIDGITYDKGIALIPPSIFDPPGLYQNCRYANEPSAPGTVARAAWKLNGQYESFSARIGLAQETYGEPNSGYNGAIYRVYLDDRLIYESGVVLFETPPIDISLNIEGGNTLILEVDSNQGYNWGDNTVWVNPRLRIK